MNFMKGELVVGHDLNSDFSALSIDRTYFETHDTSTNIKLRELAQLPRDQKPSLKNLIYQITGNPCFFPHCIPFFS